MKQTKLILAALFLIISLPVFSTPPCLPSFTTSIATQNDTVCIGVEITFTNTSDLGGESILFAQWDFDDFSQPVSSEHATHTYTQTGDYTISYNIASQSCSGLQATHTIHVIAPPNLQSGGINPSCFGFCDGSATVGIFSPPHNNYSIQWDDPGFQDTPTAIDLCDGTYTATVSDMFGCVAVSQSVSVTEPAELIVDAGSDIFMCLGEAVQFDEVTVIGGTGQYAYGWEPGILAGLDADDVADPTLTLIDNSFFTSFFVTVTDENQCTASDFLTVHPTPASIQGTVFDGQGGLITSDSVFLYKVHSQGFRWIKIDSAEINATDGSYLFTNVPIVDVVVLAKPNRANFPNMVPTFYGDMLEWNQSTIISPVCGQFLAGKNINVVTLIESHNGICDISGTIYLQRTTGVFKTQSDDPIPFIDVVVKKTPPGNAIAYTQTDAGGQFLFTDMDAGPDTLSFLVNIPGIDMIENYEVIVDIDDLEYTNKDFWVVIDTLTGETGIFTDQQVGINNIKIERKKMTTFPNPFNDKIELRFPNTENAQFGFSLFDISGKLIRNENDLHGKSYTLVTERLEKGVYIVELRTEEEVFRNRILKQ